MDAIGRFDVSYSILGVPKEQYAKVLATAKAYWMANGWAIDAPRPSTDLREPGMSKEVVARRNDFSIGIYENPDGSYEIYGETPCVRTVRLNYDTFQ